MIEQNPDSEEADQNAPPELDQAQIAEHVKSRSTWMRLVFMVLFLVIWAFSRLVIGAVVLFQFLWVLFTGTPNAELARFGHALATYTYQIVLYLTFNTERRPFPYNEWPDGPPRD